MPEILENISLKPYNTFGFDVKAKYFVLINSITELIEILSEVKFKKIKKLYLGGGSNILFLNDFEGLVLKLNLKGKGVLSESSTKVIVKVQAGEIWNDFVMFAVNNNWGGVENLSLIPGTVGAAPMQNIGAYGVEIKDVFHSLEALNLESLEVETFNKKQCEFGYRESYFKHQGKGKYVILNVSFELDKNPSFKVSYGAIAETIKNLGQEPSIQSISEAVIKIRKSKLPNPAEIGNSGSFFKNPEIPKELYESLIENFAKMPSYPINDNTVKIPAGWLIEQAGWKGKKIGEVGVHALQALVLVNYGGGTGQQIKQLAEDIQKSVFEKFHIKISPEVNFID